MNEAEPFDNELRDMFKRLGDFVEQATHQMESADREMEAADRASALPPQPVIAAAPATESGRTSADHRERPSHGVREAEGDTVRISAGKESRATMRDLQDMYTQLQQSAIEAVLPQQRGRINRRPIAPAAAGGDDRLPALMQSLLKVNQEMLVELRKVADRSPDSVFA